MNCSIWEQWSRTQADFDDEKNSALERLKNVEIFDSYSIFSDDVLTAAVFAKLFDKKVFSDITSRKNDLLTRHNEILAQIRYLSFVSTNDHLQNFSILPGYSVSNNGIEKMLLTLITKKTFL